jgi:hypothetical protein
VASFLRTVVEALHPRLHLGEVGHADPFVGGSGDHRLARPDLERSPMAATNSSASKMTASVWSAWLCAACCRHAYDRLVQRQPAV